MTGDQEMTLRPTEYPQHPEQLAGLMPREVQPPRDLWPDIEAALTDRKAQPDKGLGQRYWLQAAAVVVLVIGSSLTTYWITDDAGLATDRASAAGDVMPGSQSDELEMLAVNDLPPEAREGVIRSLVVVRLAREGIEKELQKEPNNMRLLDLLRFTYEQEADLLNDATWATITSTTRSTT